MRMLRVCWSTSSDKHLVAGTDGVLADFLYSAESEETLRMSKAPMRTRRMISQM